MTSVLVDTSVWIELFNSKQATLHPNVQTLISLIQNNQMVYICPTIYQEILQGIRKDKDFERMKAILKEFPMLIYDFPKAEEAAVSLYRSLRRQGITIRKSNDCLIAAHAILAAIPILFIDRDFQLMCDNTSLRAYRP